MCLLIYIIAILIGSWILEIEIPINPPNIPMSEIKLEEVLKGLELNMNEFIDLCTSKRYSHARIKRTIMHILLHNTKQYMDEYIKELNLKDAYEIRSRNNDEKILIYDTNIKNNIYN